MNDADESTAEAPPLLRVVRGEPTAEELAALVAVVAARTGPAQDAPAPRSRWATPVMSPTLRHGPGAWVGSGLPR